MRNDSAHHRGLLQPRPRTLARPTPAFVVTLALLVLGLVPLPQGSMARWIRQTARTAGAAGGGGQEAGYYEGLIRVEGRVQHDELARRLIGDIDTRASFHDIGATRYLKDDILLYELRPDIRREVFGHSFDTNASGLRDREYTEAKPPGTIRIVLVGASIDMGWGIDAGATYENRLEEWLNARARRAGSSRRFEVLNFSMAAYSPVQRLETLRRKAFAYQPDVVLFTRTLLDQRLQEIHLSTLLADRIDPVAAGHAYLAGPLTRASAQGGLGSLRDALDAEFEATADGVMAAVAADCQRAGVALFCVIVPRGGELDLPPERAGPVARIHDSARQHGIPVLDLSAAFDGEDPERVSVSTWDDHPGERGHELLFRELARAIQGETSLAGLLVGTDPAGGAVAIEDRDAQTRE